MTKENHSDNDKGEDSPHKNHHEEHETHTESKDKKETGTQNTLIAILAILIIMSGIQVFQTQKLLGAVSNGAVKASAQTQKSPINSPSQVGGCG